MLAYQQMQVQEVFGDYNLNHYDVKKSPQDDNNGKENDAEIVIQIAKVNRSKPTKKQFFYSIKKAGCVISQPAF